ncbi:MAG: hypothetical protein ACJ73S_15890 [Mycobacteriales bacterium]
MAEVRVARLFDGVDPETGPYFGDGRGRVDDGGERARIAGFLDGGAVVLFSTGREPDRVDPARGAAVGTSVRTDGTWVWSDGVAYYVREHGIAPEADLYAHIRELGYRCPGTDEATAQHVLETLYAPR